jgi:hypothetical protein
VRHLLAYVSEAANRVLNQNEERAVRLAELRESLGAALSRTLPSSRDCLSSLSTRSEREQLQFISRVLRLQGTREWITEQTRRVQHALRRVPLVGVVLGTPAPAADGTSSDATDRCAIATSYFEAVTRRQAHEIQRVVRSSTFWEEVRRWTGLEPEEIALGLAPVLIEVVRDSAKAFDIALARWVEKVEAECQGISPHIKGALGVGTLALAILLIAVPGPVALLTLATAKGVIGAALGELAAAAGAGAVLGKPMGRLAAVVRERLLGSREFDAVQEATDAFRSLLESTGQRLVDSAIAEASGLVMRPDEAVTGALETLREPAEA